LAMLAPHKKAGSLVLAADIGLPPVAPAPPAPRFGASVRASVRGASAHVQHTCRRTDSLALVRPARTSGPTGAKFQSLSARCVDTLLQRAEMPDVERV